MVVSDAIHNIMGGLENSGDVRLHNHRRKLKQRFDIVKKLGQGTYGKVQLGINKETGQEVAIKTIRKCKIETEADLIRIRREIQIMSSVRHPNIIHIYEVFENRDKMVLVMEYAAGGELYDYLSERKVLEEVEARRIFRQIATAIYYCHKHNICHRDLKLENILLDETGNAKIADFGLSNVFSYNNLLSTFCGSPLYASPEIVKGTPYHGPEVDCWSLGVLLYTLVYGAMPFDGSNFKRLVRQISQGDYFEPKISSPASELIADMLNVNPGRRADISAICNHWWLNETYKEQCLDVAEELASQTPVRLDLLLSLNQAVNDEKMVVANQQDPSIGEINGGKPVRSQSLGSIPPQSAAQNNNITAFPIPELKEPEDKKPKVKRKDRSTSRSRKNDRSKSRPRKSSEDAATKVKNTEEISDENLNRTFTKMPSIEKVTNNTFTKLPSPTTNKKIVADDGVKKQTTADDDSSKKLIKTVAKDDAVVTKKDSNNKKETETKKKSKIPTIDKKSSEIIEKTDEESVAVSNNKIIAEKTPSTKTERRNSKVFEIAEKFNGNADKAIKTPSKKVIVADVDKTKKEVTNKKEPSASSVEVEKPKTDNLLKKSIPEIKKRTKDEELPQVDFPLASTVNLNKLVETMLGDEPLPSCLAAPIEEQPKKPILNKQRSREEVNNAVKIISNAILEGSNKPSTLPRRRTSRAEIQLVTPTCPPDSYKTEVEHYVNKPTINHKTEVVIPISAPLPPRPLSKQDNQSKEHIIPIQIESEPSSKTAANPPLSQSRSTIPRTSSSSLSRQSTMESDSGSNISIGGEPIRRSHREVIIPIAVEGGGFVTPSTDALTRMSSVTESEDEGQSDNRCFTLRSTKRKQPQQPQQQSSSHQIAHTDTADSLSSDEEDDNFQLLTAENLFSTLLSRVRSLTQRLNDGEVRRNSAFPRSFFTHHSSFFDDPPSRRLTETRSFSRPETAPWRRSFTANNGNNTTTTATNPRREFQLPYNKKKNSSVPDAAESRLINSSNFDSANTSSNPCKYIRSRSASTSRNMTDVVSGGGGGNTVCADTVIEKSNEAEYRLCSNNDIKDNNNNDHDPEEGAGTGTENEKNLTENSDTIREANKLKIDKEFEDFFSKYKQPTKFLENNDYFTDFETRLTSQLPPCYRYITRKLSNSNDIDNNIPKSNSDLIKIIRKRNNDNNNNSANRNVKCLSMYEGGGGAGGISSELSKSISSLSKSISSESNHTDLSVGDKIELENNNYEKEFISKLKSNNVQNLETKPPARRISRFLRPDFYDTPREESKYVQKNNIVGRERSLSRQRSYDNPTNSLTMTKNDTHLPKSEIRVSNSCVGFYKPSSSNNTLLSRFSASRDVENSLKPNLEYSKIVAGPSSARFPSSMPVNHYRGSNSSCLIDSSNIGNRRNRSRIFNRESDESIRRRSYIEPSRLFSDNNSNDLIDSNLKTRIPRRNTDSLIRNINSSIDSLKSKKEYDAESILKDSSIDRLSSISGYNSPQSGVIDSSNTSIVTNESKAVPFSSDILKRGPRIPTAVTVSAQAPSSPLQTSSSKEENTTNLSLKNDTYPSDEFSNINLDESIKKSGQNNIDDSSGNRKESLQKLGLNDSKLNERKYRYFKKLSNLTTSTSEKENGTENSGENFVRSPSSSVTSSSVGRCTEAAKSSRVSPASSRSYDECSSNPSSRCDDTENSSSRFDEGGDEKDGAEKESIIDRIKRRSYYSRFNLSRQRSSNDTAQRRAALPLYSRSLSADHRYRSPSLNRPF